METVQLSRQKLTKQPEKKQNWTDLNRDGRKLNRVINGIHTRLANEPDMNIDNYVTYVSTMTRCIHEKAYLAKIVLGVDEALKEVKKR